MPSETGSRLGPCGIPGTLSAGGTGDVYRGRVLDRLADAACEVRGARASDLHADDWVMVRTKNSVYTLAVVGDGTFIVAGGWFALEGIESMRVRVAGCTWGGSAILTGMVAAPGMFLEFSNGVRTTRIGEVRVLRADAKARLQ